MPYPDDALAFIILSTPAMFEKCFIPFIKSVPQPMNGLRDPLDQCIGQKVLQIKQVCVFCDVYVRKVFKVIFA